MGAVEEAQIREAAGTRSDALIPRDAAGIARAVSRVLGMVADDLNGVISELESHEADATLAHHALGAVTAMVGVLDAIATGAPEA